MALPTFDIERHYDGLVCGIDEAGRGPWAGPVCAAAVIWPQNVQTPKALNDSKALSARTREALYPAIMERAWVGLGLASVEEIDAMNILAATKLAMTRAFDALPERPVVALVDGNQPPVLPCKVQAIVKGDSKSLSIAAASVIAKVTRDRIMRELASDFPHYGFERHAGYGTKFHQDALQTHGVCALHRRSYAPIRKLLEHEDAA